MGCIASMCLLHCKVPARLSENEQTASENFTINTQSKLVALDYLGKLYVVDHRNILTNYSIERTKLYQYANQRSGLISMMDVSNPLEILIFFDDFNKIALLDNTLSEIREVPTPSNFQDISAIGMANDGNIWVFDPLRFRLLKISKQGQLITQSSNLSSYYQEGWKIKEIKDKGNHLVLVDCNFGFHVLDNFGQYLMHFEVSEEILHTQFDGKNIIYSTAKGLYSIDINTRLEKTLVKREESSKSNLKYYIYSPETLISVYPQGLTFDPK
jgi:hypothetical protein